MIAKQGRPALRLVPPPRESQPAPPHVWFCGHCGTRPVVETDPPTSRVCGVCGLGLILEASAESAPHAGDAFIVVDQTLSVCAVSRAAEGLLGVSEPDAVNRHLSSLLMSADAEEPEGASLAVAVIWAARGDGATRSVIVRPANTFGIRLTARVASCGPPRAALLVLD